MRRSAPIERELMKRLKRTLADEENEVLDLLRRTKPSSAEELLGPVDEHSARLGHGGRRTARRSSSCRCGVGGRQGV